jgi:hypothetical protein
MGWWQDLPMLSGNLVAIGFGAIASFTISYATRLNI